MPVRETPADEATPLRTRLTPSRRGARRFSWRLGVRSKLMYVRHEADPARRSISRYLHLWRG